VTESFFFFLQNFQAAMVKRRRSRTPEIGGENHDISYEAPFTLSLAGYIDMLFFRCFYL